MQNLFIEGFLCWKTPEAKKQSTPILDLPGYIDKELGLISTKAGFSFQ